MKNANKHLLNLIMMICQLHLLHPTYCSPLASRATIVNEPASSKTKCSHVSVAELVKNSPVILKALAVHISTGATTNNQHLPKYRKTSNGIFANTASYAETLPDAQSIMLTLVPETIYRGSSLLPVEINAESGSDAETENDTINGKFPFQHDTTSHLNATLLSLACFEGSNILRILPTKIIAFGKLANPFTLYEELGEQFKANQMRDIHINMHGFYRWTQQLENNVWKLLGWDDWSDFSPCSVTCGRGVEQRYRRCLLDNPMINLNHNSFTNDDTYTTDSTLTDFKGGTDAATTLRDTNNSIAWLKNSSTEIMASKNSANLVGDLPNSLLNENDKQQEQQVGTTSVMTLTNVVITNTQTEEKQTVKKKGISTMFCEGFNVEQRSCNTFDCTDDISDLLKLQAQIPAFMQLDRQDVTYNLKDMQITNDKLENQLFRASSNLSLSNTRNYTIMLTLRAQNNKPNNEVLFSLSNNTHSLRMTVMTDGLLLHVVSSHGRKIKVPIKLNLSDYHWHKVAISIENGDFVTVHVDCVWLRSIVLSRQLAELPLHAELQKAINFRNDVQQLLIMANNEGRQQCSSRRKSINEVKRYIIDTFMTN